MIMNFNGNKIIPFMLCLAINICGCQSFWQSLDEAEYNEVEVLYTKGLHAKNAQKWEEAYRFFVKAYAVATTRGGILRFPEEPKKNNYIYTFKLITRKMEKVAEHLEDKVVKKIAKEENLGKSMGQMGQMKERQQSVQKNMQQGIFEKTMKADKKFTEAEELARREKYLEAILLLEKYIDEHRTEGEADQARKLVDEYGKLLDERRKELYDAVGLYLKKNNFPMAKELLQKMRETYPSRPEFEDALVYIDKLLKDISGQAEMHERVQEAEELARREQYLEAITVLEKYIDKHSTEKGVEQVRELVGQYSNKLEKRRKELYDAVGLYRKKNNFPMAKELLLKMERTYPPKPEHKDALTHIDRLREDIIEQEKGYEKKQEAEELASQDKYLEAILILEKYIDEHHAEDIEGQIRGLVDNYSKKLGQRRKELYDAVGVYLKKNDFSGAKELLLKMKKTYPPKPEFKDALAYIDNLLKDITEKEEEFNKRLEEAEQEKKIKR